MKEKARAYSFLISALITLLSFIFTIAIAMMVFSFSAKISYSSENKTIAINLLQTEMEAILHDLEGAEDLETYLQTFEEEEEGLFIRREEKLVNWNGKERSFELRSLLSRQKLGGGQVFDISLELEGRQLNGEKDELVQIESKKFIK